MKKISKKEAGGAYKKIALISAVILLLNVALVAIFSPAKDILRADDSGMCSVNADVVLVMDKSGSMSEGEAQSKCEWTEVKKTPELTTHFLFTKYGESENWCMNNRDQYDGDPYPNYEFKAPTYTPAANSKITDAKSAANIFLENLGADDQSALVSFADEANLDKSLSNNHSATQTAVNNLITGGATNIGEAIALGTEELGSGQANPQAVKAMILLTDGKANKPNGDGTGENQADIDLAIANAQIAASLGYKIFTIGLGSDGEINETMLQQIADDTGAKYYHVPTSAQLEGIYNQISTRICEYGSISGCKYNDSNNDGDISEENPISGWEITLSGGVNGPVSQQTDSNGCYNFAGLTAGNYTVSEVQQSGWTQTYPSYPSDNFYSFSLAEGENAIGKDFGNYFPECGNNILDESESCDDGNLTDGDGCSSSCQTEIIACQASEISRECVSDGSAEVTYKWNDSSCGNNYTQTEEDANCDSAEDDEYYNLINPDDVVINEIMYDPSAVNDIYGEWFELLNMTESDINLEGCVISDNGSNSHTLTSLIIPANGYALLARNGDSSLNGGITPIYVYSSFILGNAKDEIILTCEGEEIDIVEYDEGSGWPAGSGESISLNSPFNDNNIGSNWCKSSSIFGAGDKGTPGALNDPCGEIVCQASEISRECVSDGSAEVTYKWNDSSCGNNYTQTEEDANCACVETEVAGECADEDNRQFTFTYNYNYCQAKDPEIRADETCGGTPTYQCSDGIDNDQDGLVDYPLDPGCDSAEDDDEYNELASYCGDGNLDAGEQCDDGNSINGDGCSASCIIEVSGGGGGFAMITKPSIIITNEKVSYLGSGEALVTWETNIETTEQVAYGDNSVSLLGSPPKYGYDLVNEESSSMTKDHSVIISGLTDGIPYYFRPIADRSGSTGEVVGKEVSYEPEEKGEVKGVTDTPAPEIAPCNYLLEYIKLGSDNNPTEVKKLETFLNIFEGEKLAVNGIYEQVDFDAVSKFQKKYSEKVLSPWNYSEPTGYVYITTKKRINELYCEREFPLTPGQEAEIAKFSAIFGALAEGSGAFLAGNNISTGSLENSANEQDENAAEEEGGRVKSAETEETDGTDIDENKNKNGSGDEDINAGDETADQEESGENEQAESSSNNYLIFFFVILLIALAYYIFGYKKKQN